MLKGRGKTFAPKKVPARKPGAAPAPASARPSVDHQSNTPAPSQQPQEFASIAEKDTAPETVFADNTPNIQDGTQASSSSNAPTSSAKSASTITSQLKRKEREENVPVPTAKRSAVGGGIAASPGSAVPVLEKPASGLQSSLSVAPIADVAPPNNLRRKERAPLPSAPPSKRMSPSPSVRPASSARATVLPSGSQLSQSASSTAGISVIRYELPGVLPSALRSHSGHNPGEPADTNIRQNSEPPAEETNGGPSNRRTRYPSPENMVRIADDVPTSFLSADGGANAAGSGVSGPSDVVAMASLNPDGTSGGIIDEPVSGTEKGKRKQKGNTTTSRRRIQTANDAEDGRATVSVSLHGARRAAGVKRPRKKRDAAEVERRRRVRAATPEGASDEEIDVTVMTMGDLTKDLKIGKRFSRFAEIKEIEELKKREAMKAKMRRQHPELASLIDANGQAAAAEPNANAPAEGAANVAGEDEALGVSEREPSPEPPQGIVSGLRMRLLNGRMVLDETSLTIDRHANAQLEREGMETVEENDFSRIVTQGTYMKREPSQSWDPAANQLFYKGLRQFGTDFQMIAAMFPHRNRRQIKLKFNKEEKVNAAKINRILMNPKEPIDLEQFEKMSDKKLEPLEVIEAERAKYDAEQREEIAKFAEATAEATRKKKESIKGSEAARRILANMSDESDAEEGVGGSNKENTGKGKRKKAAPKKGRRGRNDDPGEIVGTIE